MAFVSSRHTATAALAAFALTAILVWFGYGIDPCWPCLWFAPIPAIWFALHSSWRLGLMVAVLGFLAGCFDFYTYFRMMEIPMILWLLYFSLGALVFGAGVLLLRALVRRGAEYSAVLALPAIWVTYEYARNLATPHGTAASLAYTQLECLPILQLASITGPWGISFLLMFFPAALAIALYLAPVQKARAIRVACIGLGAVLLSLVYGALRLRSPQPDSAKVTVGLLAADRPGGVASPLAGPGEPMRRALQAYLPYIQQLAAQGAKQIVLPEKIGVVREKDVPEFDRPFQELAAKTQSTLIVGLVRAASGGDYNEARIYVPGEQPATYDKHHMLPPFESRLKPGTSLRILQGTPDPVGVAICKDMDFTPLSRHYGELGAGLMLVPGWDFRIDRWWHGHIAVMRGVEDGFSIARAARDGNLTVSDDRGRILDETRSDTAAVATLLASVPAKHDRTLYLLWGDAFAWFSAALFALTLIRAVRPDSRIGDPDVLKPERTAPASNPVSVP